MTSEQMMHELHTVDAARQYASCKAFTFKTYLMLLERYLVEFL